MDDKIIMNTTLTLVKNACELAMHGTIEANTKNVKSTFLDTLDKYLEMQGKIFTEMESAGLYKIENVNSSKINKTASKYESTLGSN